MPRRPDPNLEERILKAAQVLWKRGGDQALTMRAVARAARTNTPAVYRRFKNRHALVRGVLLRTVTRFAKLFEAGRTVEEMTDVYIEKALEDPYEYRLFYAYSHQLTRNKSRDGVRPLRETRPNFGLLERRLSKQLGGSPEEYTRLALALWSMAHGTTMLLLDNTIAGHEEELRNAFRNAVQSLIGNSAKGRP
jgi:AcrR family transcriptional regulator